MPDAREQQPDPDGESLTPPRPKTAAERLRQEIAQVEHAEELVWRTLAMYDDHGELLLDQALWEELLNDVALFHARMQHLKVRLGTEHPDAPRMD